MTAIELIDELNKLHPLDKIGVEIYPAQLSIVMDDPSPETFRIERIERTPSQWGFHAKLILEP